MTDPIFMSASYQPSEYVRAQEAAGKTMPERPGLFGSEGFTFGDFLDIINPLQHIPIVATIYRAVTGDTIKPGARIAGDTLFGGPIGLVAGVADAMVQESTGKDIGEQAMAMVGVDIGPDRPSGQADAPATAVADSGRPAPQSQPQAGAGGASPEAQSAQAAMQPAAAVPSAARAGNADPKQADLKMTVGTAATPPAGQPKMRWAGAAPEPKQKEVAADDAVAESTYDRGLMAQELAEQQMASRRAIEQMMAAGQAQNPSGQAGMLQAAQAQAAQMQATRAARPTASAAAPHVGEDGKLWFPAFPRGAVPTRAVGVQQINQQSVDAKFGSARASLPPPPTVSQPFVSPVAVAVDTDGSIPSAAKDDWAERAAAGYQKYLEMQQQTDRGRAYGQAR
jgi:hypothetical protein